MRKRLIWERASSFVRKIRWWEKAFRKLGKRTLRQKSISERRVRRILKTIKGTWDEIEATRVGK